MTQAGIEAMPLQFQAIASIYGAPAQKKELLTSQNPNHPFFFKVLGEDQDT